MKKKSTEKAFNFQFYVYRTILWFTRQDGQNSKFDFFLSSHIF